MDDKQRHRRHRDDRPHGITVTGQTAPEIRAELRDARRDYRSLRIARNRKIKKGDRP